MSHAQGNVGLRVKLFDKSFIRSSGKPEISADTAPFLIPSDVRAPFIMLIINGESTGEHRVSSATISINGKPVLQRSDLNENISSIEREVVLGTANTVTTELSSKPGSFLRISITGELDWPTLVNPTLGVTISHPPSWNVQPNSPSTILNISNVENLSPESDAALAAESLFQLRLIPNANSMGLSAPDWFDHFFVRGFPVQILSRSNVLINGRSAVRIEVSEIGRTVHYYVPLGTDVIEISYSLFNPAFIGQYESMLNSIQFNR
jgi:hypothetical protein